MFCLIDEWKEGEQCSVRRRSGEKESNVLLAGGVERSRTVLFEVDQWNSREIPEAPTLHHTINFKGNYQNPKVLLVAKGWLLSVCDGRVTSDGSAVIDRTVLLD